MGTHRYLFVNVLTHAEFEEALGDYFEAVMDALGLDTNAARSVKAKWRFRINVYHEDGPIMSKHRDKHGDGARVTTILALGVARTLRFRFDPPAELPALHDLPVQPTYDVDSGRGRVVKFGWEANLVFTHEVLRGADNGHTLRGPTRRRAMVIFLGRSPNPKEH